MSIRRYIKRIVRFLPAALAVAVASCVADDPFALKNVDPDTPIRVGANVNALGSTRAYKEQGEISDTTYFLVYNQPSSSSYYGHAWVNFGNEEGPTTGFAYYLNGTEEKELKWLNVYGKGTSNATFYLSNFSKDRYTTYSSTSLLYWRLNPPITAAPLDKKWGLNDIILGKQLANGTASRVDFELKHILSLLKINVEVYGASDKFFVDLDQAEVTISNLYRSVTGVYIDKPETYTYSSSTPSSSSSSGYYNDLGAVTLVSPDDDTPHWEVNPSNQAPQLSPEGNEMKVYETCQFIMPPQSFTGERPRLSIKLPRSAVMGGDVQGDVTYSGIIPEVMFELDEDGFRKPTPYNIALRSGYQLNITATINSPETELVFAPVTIEPWVSKGSATISTKQVGIYNERDFRNMLIAFETGERDELSRYGYDDRNGNTVFNIWADISLTENEIGGRMSEAYDEGKVGSFCFLLNGYNFTLAEKGEELPSDTRLTGLNGQVQLHNIVTGKSDTFTGIDTREKFEFLLDAMQNSLYPDIALLSNYGEFNNSTNSYTAQITGTFDLFVDDIWQKFTAWKFWGYDLSWDYNPGCNINVKILAGSDVAIPCPGDIDGFDKLRNMMYKQGKVITFETGIRTPEEMYFLVDVYNNYALYNENLLTLFGEKNGSSNVPWTFYSDRNMTYDGERVLKSMEPNSALGRPDFSFGWSGTNTFVGDDYTIVLNSGNARTNGSWITLALKGNGKATGNTDLGTVVGNYKSNYYYGVLQRGWFKAGKWTLNFTYSNSQTVPYTTIFGGMLVDKDSGKFDYDFNLGNYQMSVTAMPVSEGSDETMTLIFKQEQSDDVAYPNSAADLKRLANGTYWEYYSEWTKARQRGKKR